MEKLVFAALLFPAFAFAAEWQGTVVGISDGDTLTVLNADKRQVKIRLIEIDAPEKNQDFGQKSKDSLSQLCFKKSVVVDDKGTDKYKRILGRIKCDGIDANVEQVKRGMAWAYRKYLTDWSIANLEEQAKSAGIGLWVNPHATPPWEFRHGGKSKQEAVKVELKQTYLECGAKTACREMISCDEAIHYLNDCGVSRLDQDDDKVPCDSICGR